MRERADTIRHRRRRLKVWKIAVGSCLAIMIAEFFRLQYATSAGIITLLTVQDTRKDTIQLTIERLFSFLLSVLLIFVCFHFPGRLGWINYGVYIFFMVGSCYQFGWQNTVSVNAVMGTHYLMSPDYSLNFALNELALVLTGTGLALAMNWKMPSNVKAIRADMDKVEADMKKVLRELAAYMEGNISENYIWLDLDELEEHIREGVERAREQAHNSLSEADLYYVKYMDMRLQQCILLQALKDRVLRIEHMPSQSKIISRYLDHVAFYVQEENVPDQQIRQLNQVFAQMKREPLPVSRGEFESRAMLYHVLMDLEEFLFIKQHFVDADIPRPEGLKKRE